MLSKTTRKRILKTIAFCCILFFILSFTAEIVRPRDNSVAFGMLEDGARGFYSEKTDSLDTFFIGNSNAYAGFSPMVLWKNYGYTSYVCAEAGQNISQASFLFDEIVSKQKPKLIVLEVDELYGSGYQDLVNTTINRVVPLLYNHSRWKTIKLDQIFRKTNYTKHRKNKGFWPCEKTVAYEGPEYMRKSDDHDCFSKGIYHVLKHLISKCNKHNVSFMLTHLPSAENWNYARHNAVEEFAKQNHLLFLDLDCERDLIKFDLKTDFRDGGAHMNSSGADKCTLRIGEFINKNYNLPDHRGDQLYHSWNDDYVGYPHNAEGRE